MNQIITSYLIHRNNFDHSLITEIFVWGSNVFILKHIWKSRPQVPTIYVNYPCLFYLINTFE